MFDRVFRTRHCVSNRARVFEDLVVIASLQAQEGCRLVAQTNLYLMWSRAATHRHRLVSEEMNRVKLSQMLQTVALVPSFREHVKTDLTAWKRRNVK